MTDLHLSHRAKAVTAIVVLVVLAGIFFNRSLIPLSRFHFRHFSIVLDRNDGKVTLLAPDGNPFIDNLGFAIHTDKGAMLAGTRSFPFTGYKKDRRNIPGKPNLILKFFNKTDSIEAEYHISQPDSVEGIISEVICVNLSGKEVNIKSIEVIRLLHDGALSFANSERCMTNGAMYYDAGLIHSTDQPINPKPAYGETKGGKMQNQDLHDPKAIESWWNIALFSDPSKESLSLGYIENLNSLGRIRLHKDGQNRVNLVAESVLCPGFVLFPNKRISSDRFLINKADCLEKALSTYSESLQMKPVRSGDEVINGWCSWFYTHSRIDEKEILTNAEFISKNLSSYGMDYVQVDEGYQLHHGDWDRGPGFPAGMEWLAGEIRKLGLKPGLWIAPFVISENSKVFAEHPEWLVKNPDGSLKRIGPWPSEDTDWYRNETPKRYCLDLTQPGAEKWFTDLFDTIVNNWGYQMIKLDFVAWTVFSVEQFYDRSKTPAMVYRKALDIIRRTAGDSCHILDCGPGHVTAGLINSMRIEYDQYYGYLDELENQYFRGPSSSSGAIGKRYFYHLRNWVNDADHICMDLFGAQRARAVASLLAMSGGNMISGDRLYAARQTNVDILKKVLPSAEVYTKPAEFGKTDPPTLFYSRLKTSFDSWTVAACFNPSPALPFMQTIEAKEIGLDSNKTYICFDFWNEKIYGEMTGKTDVMVPPGDVCVLGIREKKEVPFVLSTSRHIFQAYLELDDVSYNTETDILSGWFKSPPGSTQRLYVYVPEGFEISEDEDKSLHPAVTCLPAIISGCMLMLEIEMPAEGKKHFTLRFRKILKDREV